MLPSCIIDIPRPLIDPVTSLAEVLGIVSLALRRPRQNNSTVLVMDKQRRGVHLFHTAPLSTQTVHHIVRECSHVALAHGIVIVSSRTTPPLSFGDESLLHTSSHILTAAGIQLIDWAVIGYGGMYCPRTLCGGADPWPYGSTWV